MKSTIFPVLVVGMVVMSCGAHKKIEVVTLPVPSDPTVSIRLWFKVGSQNDPPGKEGLAALTAQMLADASTKKNSYEQILEKLYPMAAGYEAQVDKEMTVIMGRVHKDNLAAYTDLVFRDWWTRAQLRTDDQGRATQRAFLGTHRVKVAAPGRTTAVRDISLGRDGLELPIVLNPAPPTP